MRDGDAIVSKSSVSDPSGPSAASDVIKCVVMGYEKGTSGNHFIRKEIFWAVLNRNYKIHKDFQFLLPFF